MTYCALKEDGGRLGADATISKTFKAVYKSRLNLLLKLRRPEIIMNFYCYLGVDHRFSAAEELQDNQPFDDKGNSEKV